MANNDGGKSEQWKGYYDSIYSGAERQDMHPLDFLDHDWADGRTNAERHVLPRIDDSSVVLEIAAGIGRVSRFVAPHCKQLCCADILDEALAGSAKYLSNFENVEFQKINGYDLSPFKNNTFDCVFSFTAFFHFDFELVVNYFFEIKRVLKPGGIAILEFKKWLGESDVRQLLHKIRSSDGLATYERRHDKWRYVSSDMLGVLADHLDLEVLEPGVTHYTFRKQPASGPVPTG